MCNLQIHFNRMQETSVKILSTTYLTHNVKRIVVEKPEGFVFTPGQGTDVSIDKKEWRDQQRPFTFTSLNHHDYLEFIIKIYRNHHGVTEQIEKLQNGDSLIIRNPWGAITYKGPGVFISGGTGITPFIAILRQLEQDRKLVGNTLIASYRTSDDVLLDDEFDSMLGTEYFKVFTRENVVGFLDARIHEDALVEMVKDFNRNFYICGPSTFAEDIERILTNLGVKSEALIVED